MAEQQDVAVLPESIDVAVIGAGPAGLAAAAICARSKLSTVLIDRQPTPGGHAYRLANHPAIERDSLYGKEYKRGTRLIAEFHASGASCIPGAIVTRVTPDLLVSFDVGGAARQVQARRIILATGAVERAFPIHGASLPGVMMAGAAQGLLPADGKSGMGATVLAGCGPLLWLLAWQLGNAGVRIDALLDTAPKANRSLARPFLLSYVLSPHSLKQWRLSRAVRGNTKVIEGVASLHAEGDGRLQRVVFRDESGTERTLPADTLVLHQGTTPNAALATAVGVQHLWDEQQQCFSPVLDHQGNTSVEGIAIAGDAAGIGGAQVAAWRGVLVAAGVIRKLRPGPAMDSAEKVALNALRRFMRGRRYLDLRHRPELRQAG